MTWDGVSGVQFVNAAQSGYPGIAFTISGGDQMVLYTTGKSLVLRNRSRNLDVWEK